MKNKIYLSILFIVINFAAYSQLDPQFTNNMFYKLGVNPGYAGADGKINGLILNRYQWEGMPGAPKTLVFSGDAAIEAFGFPGGIGLNVINDQWGFFKNSFVNLNYVFRKFIKFGNLGIGILTGLYNMSINGEWKIPDETGGIYTAADGDRTIPQAEASRLVFDLGFGLYLSANHYYLGLSATHLNQAEVVFSDESRTFLARHYYFSGGYNIKLADPLFELRPSFMFKTDLAGWQFDGNVNVVYNDKIWAGLTYRVNDAVALLMGLELFNGIRLGYSFDAVTTGISRYGWASHEIFISYSVQLEKNRNQKYKSVRFL